jgi:multidrug efflux pump subunit AcrA (membrane-fusion protein)
MENYTQPASSNAWQMKAAVAALAAALLGFGGYAVHEHSAAEKAEQQSSQVNASLQATNAQIAQLTSKLNDIETARVAKEEQAAQARAVVQQRAAAKKAKASAAHTVRRDDPRWKQMQSRLDAQQSAIDAAKHDIDSTNENLTSAKTELSGSIAKTHAELVVLQKKGERNYYEFDLTKEKSFHRGGPIGVRLRKANVKHQYADLELLVDDRSLTQKHVNLMQPTVFYAADSEVPVEIVINSISKDHIHGYVSAPKYRRSDLASTQADANTATPVETSSNGSPTLKSRNTPN